MWSITSGFSIDNKLLYSTWGDFHLWDIASGHLLLSNNSGANVAALSPGGKFVAIGTESPDSYNYKWNYQLVRSGVITLYDVATGKTLVTLNTGSDEVIGLAFSPDGRFLASVCLDDTVQLWAVTSMAE